MVRPDDLEEDLTLAELFERWPMTASVFVENRMACVGCPMAKFNTLADAIRIYSLSQEGFFQELARAINEKEGDENHS